MTWKDAIGALKKFHSAGADGSPASIQKELDGLEESLKGWESRDEHREKSFVVWREENSKLRAEVERLGAEGKKDYDGMREFQAKFIKADHELRDMVLQIGELKKEANFRIELANLWNSQLREALEKAMHALAGDPNHDVSLQAELELARRGAVIEKRIEEPTDRCEAKADTGQRCTRERDHCGTHLASVQVGSYDEITW